MSPAVQILNQPVSLLACRAEHEGTACLLKSTSKEFMKSKLGSRVIIEDNSLFFKVSSLRRNLWDIRHSIVTYEDDVGTILGKTELVARQVTRFIYQRLQY